MYRYIALSLFASNAAAQIDFSIANWHGGFDVDSGVLQSMSAVTNLSFDFAPTDVYGLRNGVGNYHTGDLTMRWRVEGQGAWEEVDTAAVRSNVTKPISSTKEEGPLLHSYFDNVFPEANEYLNITRDWQSVDGDLVLSATVNNHGASTIEIGAFGFPIEMNSIFTGRTPDDTTVKCVLLDPYIGLDAGYVQVTRLTGTGPNMVITPYGKSSKFEAWRFLDEDGDTSLYYQSQTFEGFYSWQTLSLAYAQNEWNSTTPWNVPTSSILAPGESITFALRFGVAQENYEIETAVESKGVPVAVGIPGYVLPTDMVGQMYLTSNYSIEAITTSPEGMLSFAVSTAPNSSWKAYTVKSTSGTFGRVRATITYADGKVQTVHYFVTDAAVSTATKFGDFLFTNQWYTDDTDPFHRAPSVISYDYSVRAQVLQEMRAWIAGISDEGGAGSFEAAAMKTSVHPTASEVFQLEQMATKTVWGELQDTNNSVPNIKYGVKRSLFYYDPTLLPNYTYDPSIDWTTWESWNKNSSYSVWRAYDYVHVTALYWGLYSADQANPGVLALKPANWYLIKAYETILETQANDYYGQPVTAYGNDGLMCETVWLKILLALQAENLTTEFSTLEAAMKARWIVWSTMSQPYGSEMAWDSTGQEGVYLWSQYFNDTITVEKTLDSIRGYMPTVAHWGWNGNARRYWDFLYGGKLQRIERMIHHYGSGLNALPLLDSYKRNTSPSSYAAIHDLRVAYGGSLGPLTNINAAGFGAQAFHSFPDTLAWEAYSGDYGPNYLGHILGATTYLLEHPDFGWISFGGNVQQNGSTITVEPRDTVRRRLYIAAVGLSVEFNAGQISEFTLDAATKSVTITLDSIDASNATEAAMVYEDTLSTGIKPAETYLPYKGGFAVKIPGIIKFEL